MTDRETLEIQAKQEICACRVYDLADSIDTMSDEDLRDVISHKVKCENCGD